MDKSIKAGNIVGSVVSTGQVGNVVLQGASYIERREPEKTLAEAAFEIQRLLQQLEETNPSATHDEQAAYINVATKPDLRSRAANALKQGGETAIDEFVLENKYLKVVKAILKGWAKI